MWTSVGVIIGVAAVAVTGWERLDPIVGLAVAVNIVATGVAFLRRSVGGLMDRALTADELAQIEAALGPFKRGGVRFHALRTRQAGRRAFISPHVLVPRAWTVQRGHEVAEQVEAALRQKLPYATVFTHLEPAEDRSSFADTARPRSVGVIPSPVRA
jgi:cation diffusion facilitator family transporter